MTIHTVVGFEADFFISLYDEYNIYQLEFARIFFTCHVIVGHFHDEAKNNTAQLSDQLMYK